MSQVRNVIIIGSGPAGLTAAIYSSRANLAPLLFEGYQAGGQLMTTTDVENYPGFPEGIMGPDLMIKFRAQAARFGTEIITKDVTRVDLSKRPFKVTLPNTDYFAKSIIISTGAKSKLLGLEEERRLMGRGVSTCATCDGAFFKGQDIFVIGGGDSAMEEACFLTKFAKTVTVIHRRDTLRASKIMQQRAFKNPKVHFIWNSEITRIFGEQEMTGVHVHDLQTGNTQDLEGTGLFIAIGHIPTTDLFKGQLAMDANGYLITDGKGTHTNVPGVFACGDVQDHIYRQAVTAAGSGCAAAIDCERWLEHV